ncbi:polysaccharide deacetylase family protein [Cellulomonas sp. PhB150]|uniref:polysaccharide deacetylase family protein n=1 Tax=Cellulomonas sp. PhB150 TaxID=2485188 RepID=UPI0018F6D1F7|nr:polysaccharide deacetylase family protein [Cellulomonas sp. PhB150]
MSWAHRSPAAAAQVEVSSTSTTGSHHPVSTPPAGTAPVTLVAHRVPAAPAVPAAKVNCNVKKCIALTFDDGPGPYTHKLLGELAAAKVEATFFLIGGNVGHYPSLVRAEVAGGHAVGNHSWSHPQLTLLSSSAVAREVARTQTAIHHAAGITPTLMRPPYGAVNPRVLGVLGQHHLSAVLWNVDTEDWKNRSVSITTQRALAGARPGAIILMHDIHPTTVQAVPGIIKALKARGYTLVTVPQLLGHPVAGHKYFNR